MDLLKTTLEKIEAQCKESSIGIFYGGLQKDLKTKIVWNHGKSNEVSLEAYFSLLKNAQIKIIAIEFTENKIDIDDEQILEVKKFLKGDQRNSYEEALSVVSKHLGYLVNLKSTFFLDGFCYEFFIESSWAKSYWTLNDGLSSDDLYEQAPEIKESTINELIDKITTDQKYLVAKLPSERGEVATKIVESNGIKHYDNILDIIWKAERIFIQEIKPKEEAEIGKKIRELKEKKFTKIKIKNQLSISQSLLDKYYYIED